MVIIFYALKDAEKLSKKLKPHRRSGDKEYSLPVMSSDKKRWAIQVLDEDLKKLDKTDFDLLQHFPTGFFDETLK